MAQRIVAAILMALFACVLYLSVSDIAQVVERGHFGDIFMLLFCVITCVGWIGFLAALCWPIVRDRSTPHDRPVLS
jgi:hypothetical protein